MSGPIRSTITFSLPGLKDGDANRFAVAPNANWTPEQSAAALEAAVAAIHAEIRLVTTRLDDVRNALNIWADLTRKMSLDERTKEEALCEKFKTTVSLDQNMIDGSKYLDDLRTVATSLGQKWAVAKAALAPGAGVAIPAAAGGEVDLDTLKITTFSEGADEFLEFKASFEATVCLKYSSPTLRMLYLKMYLRPPAANLIKGYRNDEFDAAWIVLKEKYGEREEYIRYLHNRLATISACHRPNDFNKFVVELNQILHKLSSAGEDVSGPQTFLQLERKLPKFVVRKILEKKAATPGWTTEKMRMALNEISKTENDVSNIVSIDDPSARKSQKFQRWNNDRLQKRGFQETERGIIITRGKRCLFGQ